ncbi:S41 family peptidase [Lysobacter sp. A3-1-A15]|uniref:S41 family peptidase n=1 Tax=Novilysobacter viscosus TaxID=3098602 RepID=UPI002ED94142
MQLDRTLGWVLAAAMGISPYGPVPADGHAPDASFDGVWHQRGYGRLLEIRGARAKVFDSNSVECHASVEEPVGELGTLVRVAPGRVELRYGINTYRLDRIEALPARCTTPPADPTDPLLNFDSLWDTLRVHYPFFERRGVDWPALRKKYRPRLAPDSTDPVLFDTLEAMLGELRDGHVKLERPDTLPHPAASGGDHGEPSNFELSRQAQQAILERHVRDVRQYNAGIVRWGMVDPRVGYVQLNSMLMLADYGLEPTEDLREFFGRYFAHAEDRINQYQDEVEGARNLVGRMLADLGDADSIILDLRFNGGGKDGAALEFLRPFVDAPYRAFSKVARDADGNASPNWIQMTPAARGFDGRVFVLTSPATASAAEILVLASLPLPRVVRIGSATEGIFSDSLDKTLPNGWEYTLSNEVYATPDGRLFEGTGIPPDHAIAYPRQVRAFYRQVIEQAPSGDPAIEMALRIAHENR